jgi:selenide,water dikinase
MSDVLRMSDYALSGGCGAKVGPGDLHDMLCGLSLTRDPRVLVGVVEGDDAGVVSLSRTEALVHTIDVITPIVDDPETYGRVSATNAISDVYAMGGRPTSAVAFLGVPRELPAVAVQKMLEGAADVLSQAKAPLVGGHTVKDKELKLGFAVSGLVQRTVLTTVARAKAGAVLVLTKALGTGVMWQAMKLGRRTPDEEAAVVRSMTTSNARAAQAMVKAGVRAATDVTGFGLVGHALNIARHSHVDLVLEASSLPALPGVLAHLEAGTFPPTVDVNRRGYGDKLVVEEGVPEVLVRLASDPQTSGGLLMVVPPKKVEAILRATGGYVVGRTTPRHDVEAKVRLVRG